MQASECRIGWCSMRVLSAALKDTLVVLDLSSNSIGNLGAQSLTQLTRLQRLDVSENSITAAGAAAISKISTLRHLNLSENAIRDEGCGHLSSLCCLQSLNIATTEQTGAKMQFLLPLAATLQHLNIGMRHSSCYDDEPAEAETIAAALVKLTSLTSLSWSAGECLSTTDALSTLTKLERLSLPYHLALLGGHPDGLAGLAALTALTHLNLRQAGPRDESRASCI